MTDQALLVNCPFCRAPARVDAAATARGPVQCPNPQCGKAFQVAPPPTVPPPAAVPVSPQPAPQAPAPAPVAPQAAQGEAPESELARIHLQLVRRYPVRFLAYLVGIVGGAVAAIWSLSSGWTFWAIVLGAVALFLAWRLLSWWVRVHGTTLTITNKRCIVETGALTKESTEVLRQHITELQVRQNLLMRLLNVGDLIITSDRGSKRQVVLMAVPQPEVVADQLRVNAA